MRNRVAPGATTPHRYARRLPSRQGVPSMLTFWVQMKRATSTQGTVSPAQRPTTAAAGSGLAGDRLLDLVAGDEQALVAAMTRLPSAFLAGLVGRRGRAAFAVKAVRRGRQGGVAGIGVQLGRGVRALLLELADLLLLLTNQGEGVVELHLQTAVGGLQLGDTLLGIGLFQCNDT